jgi:hypothetical protein
MSTSFIGGDSFSLISSSSGGGGTITGGGTDGQIAFWDAATNITGSDNLFWDNATETLTIHGANYNVGTYWKGISNTTLPSGTWRGITYGNGLFVAVSSRGGAANSTTTSIATSPDGVNWTFRTIPSTTSLINITYQNGIFVAIGQLSQRAFYSYDGVTWFNGVGFGGQGYGITYGKDKFVACKIDNAGNRIVISYDGINWQGVATPSTMDLPFTSVTYGNGIYVAVAESTSSASIAISYDGLTWNNVTRPSGGTITTYNVCYGKGLFVLTCTSGKMMTSPDGVNWTQRDTPLTGLIWKCIYAEGVFIAAGCFSTTQNKFIYSIDGITWEEANTPAFNDWSGFAYGNGMLLCLSFNGTNSSALVAKSGELNNFITQNDNITHGKQTFTDDVVLSQNNSLGIGTSTPISSLVVTSGNTSLGDNSDSGERLQVTGTMKVTGNTAFTAGNISIGTSTATDWVNIAASTTAKAQILLAAGVDPTSPANGEIWFDGTNIYMRIGGVTKTFTLT